MKQVYLIFLSLLIAFSACKKNSDDNNTGWSEEDQAVYSNVIALQDKAGENWSTWSQTMDSLEAINKLQQFFLSDPSVSSATLGSQGIAVQYTNGVRGVILINPEEYPGNDSLKMAPLPNIPSSNLNGRSIVNRKKAILLNPTYWERSDYTDWLVEVYNSIYFPRVKFILKTAYNQEASLDLFTKLSEYGIIHIYSHGFAWPKKENITEVYVFTGEVADPKTNTIRKYRDDFYDGNIPVCKVLYSEGTGLPLLALSSKFIANRNDFSKDTVLFYGGFCYSFLGAWPEIERKFAKGAYFGFTWHVETEWNIKWARTLIASLSDTLKAQPCSTEEWITGSDPPKSYFDEEDGINVRIQYTGDGTLTLWKKQVPAGPVPVVETLSATNITSTTATLNATINPKGLPTTGSFEYGLTSDYGNTMTLPQNPLNGNQPIPVNVILSDLVSDMTYHFRIKASNSSGIASGNDMTFKTLSGALQIGQEYEGGIIFYLEPDGMHGLIAAPFDHRPGVVWGCYGVLVGGTSTEIGSGQANTLAIISTCGEESIAARICDELVLNGYDDWFLPSKEELNQMYLQKSLIGGFDIYYWSSSEYDADNAWSQDFSSGSQVNYITHKGNAFYVRAIRAF